MINCDHCNKSFKYPCFLEKHLSRKIPCFMKLPTENMLHCNDKINTLYANNTHQKQSFDTQKAIENGGNQAPNANGCTPNAKGIELTVDKQGRTKKHPCTKCDKTFYNKRDCEKHIQKCNGCDVLQCPTCLKYFSSYSTKSEHIKNVKCKPPEPLPEPKEIPRVIRKVTATVKLQIGASQSWKCNSCHELLKSTFHIDHIIQICKGGTNHEDNLQALCVECHAQKTQLERQM